MATLRWWRLLVAAIVARARKHPPERIGVIQSTQPPTFSFNVSVSEQNGYMSKRHSVTGHSPSSALTDRLNDGRLEVPTAVYTNSLGREIVIIGVKHYASSQFWTNISVQLTALDGKTAIHFERPIRDLVPRSLRFKSLIGRSLDRSQHRIWTAAGCEFQFDALSIGPNWENHDVPVARTLSAIHIGPLIIAAVVSLLLSLNQNVARAYGRSQVRQIHTDAGKTFPMWMVMKTSVILRERNSVAARAALAASNDVVMIWGHSHLPGIGKLLERGGFVLARVNWNQLFAA